MLQGNAGTTLLDAARLASWVTPAAFEAGGTPESFLARKKKLISQGADMGLSITSLAIQARLTDSGETLTGSTAGTVSTALLSPEHSRWLMGLPSAWESCAPTAMRLSRPWRQR